MPTLINNKVTYQGGEAVPAIGSPAYIAAQNGLIAPTPVSTTLNASTLGNTNPLGVPTIAPTAPIGTAVSAPIGTTVDANGNATIPPPPAPTAEAPKSTSQKIMDKFGLLGDTLATKGTVTQDLQQQQQLAQKTERATQDYNAYNKAKLDLAQQIESIYTRSGGTTAGAQAEASAVSRAGNANLANLAIQAQASQGLLSAAEKTIKDKLDAQFQPITDQIDYLTKFQALNQNDLTEKEMFELQQQATTKKTELADINGAMDTIQQAILKNGAPSSVYSSLDKITNDFVAGKISASEAKAKMYQAAGAYGVDKTKSTGQGLLGTLPTSIQGKVISLATNFGSTDIAKKYNSTVDSINVVNGIDPKSKNPADHQQVVYAFAKALDPDSAVREGEYATIKKYAQGALTRYGKEIENAIAGTGFLSEGAIKNIQDTMNKTYESRKPVYDNAFNGTAKVINSIAGGDVAGEIMIDYTGGVAPKAGTKSPTDTTKDPLGIL